MVEVTVRVRTRHGADARSKGRGKVKAKSKSKVSGVLSAKKATSGADRRTQLERNTSAAKRPLDAEERHAARLRWYRISRRAVWECNTEQPLRGE